MNKSKVYLCDTVVAASHIATERDFECPFLGTTEVKRSINRGGALYFKYLTQYINNGRLD